MKKLDYSVPDHCVAQFRDRCGLYDSSRIRNIIRSAMDEEVREPKNEVVDLGREPYQYLVVIKAANIPGMWGDAYVPVVADEKFGGKWVALTALDKEKFESRKRKAAHKKRVSNAALAMREGQYILTYSVAGKGSGMTIATSKRDLDIKLCELFAEGCEVEVFERVPKDPVYAGIEVFS